MEYYRSDNTTGYTQTELDALNEALQDILAGAADSSNDAVTPDEVDRLIKLHNDTVAGR